MASKKLLVTGGLGFIGCNFIRYYLEEHPEDSVLNLDKKTYAANLIALKELERYPNYTCKIGDICDEELIMQITRGIDVLVNFAAETHVDRSISDPQPFALTNVVGTLNLLKAAKKNNVARFHHVSTDEVFGSLELDSNAKFSERTCYNPRNPYSATKAASDFLVRSFHETYGLNTTITNCSNNFGPYQHEEKLIPKSILKLLSNEPVPIYGDGKNVRDWLYVGDHCSAIDLVLQKGRSGETYCVSAGNEISNLEMVKILIDIMHKDEKLIEFVEDRPGHDRRYALDATKVKTELGWTPSNDLRSCLARTIEWYRTHHVMTGVEN